MYELYFVFIVIILIINTSNELQYETSNIIVIEPGINKEFFYFEDIFKEYKIRTNYLHLSIKIYNAINIKYIQISDREIYNNSLGKCPSDSNICQTKYVNQYNEFIFESRLCVHYFFIKLWAINESEKSQFKMDLNYVKNKKQENCKYIHENSFTYCGQSSLEECRNCKTINCAVIQCGFEENGFELEDKFVYKYILYN